MDVTHRVPPSAEVILNGEKVVAAAATVSVFDMGFQRGYGCFEALRAYGGRPFRMAQHLDRLGVSAAGLGIGLPPRGEMEAWIGDVAEAGGDCIVRILVSSGSFRYEVSAPPTTVVFSEAAPTDQRPIRILPMAAPWHGSGVPWPLAGSKTLSYAPNLASAFAAQREGFDDALLLTEDGTVLEGTTYGIGWFAAGVFETPALTTGILPSITRAAALEVIGAMGVEIRETVVPLARLLEADEVCALSTVKEILAVRAVGATEFAPGVLTGRLADGFSALVRAETAA